MMVKRLDEAQMNNISDLNVGKFTRREFIKLAGLTAISLAGIGFAGCSGKTSEQFKPPSESPFGSGYILLVPPNLPKAKDEHYEILKESLRYGMWIKYASDFHITLETRDDIYDFYVNYGGNVDDIVKKIKKIMKDGDHIGFGGHGPWIGELHTKYEGGFVRRVEDVDRFFAPFKFMADNSGPFHVMVTDYQDYENKKQFSVCVLFYIFN